MYFHYSHNHQIAQAARILSSKTNPILAILSTRIDNSVKWFTTSAFVDFTGIWRASINKALQEYLDLGWVEHVSIENVPVLDQGELTKYRKRNLWKLSDQEIGLELLYNSSLPDNMLQLGALALCEDGVDMSAKFQYESSQIADALRELGSEPILNFLNAFQSNELYYQNAVEKLRGNGISCPKHDKLSKLCDVSFERIELDLITEKILDRQFSPDKSSGAPGYTYFLSHPGIRLNIRSTIDDLSAVRYDPKPDDWRNSSVTASQISTLREGIVIGQNLSQ